MGAPVRRVGDRGTATVLMAGVLAVVTVTAMAATAATGAVGAQARAQSAADLGALAAATQARDDALLGVSGPGVSGPGVSGPGVSGPGVSGQRTGGTPCGRAAAVAALHGTEVVACVVEAHAVVTVTVRTTDAWRARGVSRAGPAGAGSTPTAARP